MSWESSCFSTDRKPAFSQILPRLFLAPHRAESLAPLGQRDGHAVQARHGVEEGPDRVADVVVDVARSFDVLHQVDAVSPERPGNALQDVQRLALIVHRIERGDEVERFGRGRPVEVAEIDVLKFDVLQPSGRRLGTRGPERFVRKIHTHEMAFRKEVRQPVQNAAAAASDIECPRAALEVRRQAGYEREDVGFERGENRQAAIFRHHRMESRESLVRDAAAVLEARDDVVLHAAEERNILSENGQVIRPGLPRQRRGVFRWQLIADALRIDIDDARRDHRTEPFAHVALVETSVGGKFSRGHGRLAPHAVEEASPVPDGGHQAQGGFVERVHEAAAEGLGFPGIEPGTLNRFRHRESLGKSLTTGRERQ